MIDRLEISVASSIPLSGRLNGAYRTLRKQNADLYKEMIDLRQIGLSARLFLSCRYSRTHKLVLRQAAKLSMSEMAVVCREVFECNVNDQRIARVDFAVDVPGIPTNWFREHVRVARKRSFREIGCAGEMKSDRRGQTLYFGNGADLLRVYDKNAERKNRKQNDESDNPDPSSHNLFCNDDNDCALTRVERQIRTGRIPSDLASFEGLRNNAAKFNPFAPMIFVPGGKPKPDFRDYPPCLYLQGRGLRAFAAEVGLAKAWNLISSRSGGNANRIFERLADFLPPTSAPFQSLDLFRMYQRSVGRQMPGPQTADPQQDQILSKTKLDG